MRPAGAAARGLPTTESARSSTRFALARGACGQGVDGLDSVEAADDPDQLSLDPNVRVELGLVGRVGRLEANAVLLLEEALEGDGVLFDLSHDDVAVPGGLLRPDQDEVAIRDVGLDHRV